VDGDELTQKQIQFQLSWHKVDTYSIRLNIHTDMWTDEARVEGDRLLGRGSSPQYFFKDISVMVQVRNSQMIYGSISKWVRKDKSKCKMIKYLMERNKQWNKEILHTIGWEAIHTHP